MLRRRFSPSPTTPFRYAHHILTDQKKRKRKKKKKKAMQWYANPAPSPVLPDRLSLRPSQQGEKCQCNNHNNNNNNNKNQEHETKIFAITAIA